MSIIRKMLVVCNRCGASKEIPSRRPIRSAPPPYPASPGNGTRLTHYLTEPPPKPF